MIETYSIEKTQDGFGAYGTLANGGKGSGNFGHYGRPGEVGGSSSSNNISSLAYKDDGVNGAKVIKSLMTELREKHPEIYNEEILDKRLRSEYEWSGDYELKEHGIESYEDYKSKVLNGEIWPHLGVKFEGGNRYPDEMMKIFGPDYGSGEYGSEFLWGMLAYTRGAEFYGKESGSRAKFDKEHGISAFIDNNKDVQYNNSGDLFRGLTTTKERVKEIAVGAELDLDGCSSWSANEKIARNFLTSSLIKNGNVKVLFRDVTKGSRKAMINPFSSLSGGFNDGGFGDIEDQAEVLYSGSARFVVKNVQVKKETFSVKLEKKELDVYYVDVESK